MKHNILRCIGHNIADSFASGLGLMIGYYSMDVFEEAQQSPEGFILVDFLRGTTEGGPASESLVKALGFYRDALPELCVKHGVSVTVFRELYARYAVDGLRTSVLVSIEDKNGRRSEDKYVSYPLRHVKIVDSLGRVRTKRR